METTETGALRAARALTEYRGEMEDAEGPSPETVLLGLLTDLRHLALDLDLDYMGLDECAQACFECEQVGEFSETLARVLPGVER